MCSSGGYPPVALAIRIYFVLLPFADGNIQEATPRAEGPYGLQSWTQEPMFVDEPRWILLSHRTPAQFNSEDEADDRFWVTRGRKRYLHSPRPPTVLDRRVRFLLEEDSDDDDSWNLRGKKSTYNGILENDPFWVNRGKKADSELADGESRVQFHRGKREARIAVGDLSNRDPDRDKKGDLTSVLSNGDKFWVNRGKKDLQSVLESGDTFWVNRGKKSDLQSALNGGDKFWVNRGKKNNIQSLIGNGKDPIWLVRGKKNDIESVLNRGDPFWVNKGKKNDLQSALNGGDQFWVNRGKKSEIQSMLSGGDQFWVNRGKKNELHALLNNGDQFWVNRGKKDALSGQSPDDADVRGQVASSVTFKKYPSSVESLFWSDSGWNDRLKKDPLKTILKPDPFFVNRGKKSVGNINETQSRDKLDGRTPKFPLETPFLSSNWLERSKKTNDRLDPFWVTRGKRMEMHIRQRRHVSESTTKPPLKNPASSRQKRMAKSPRMIPSYDKDYPFKKDSDVNSLLLWWKGKSAPGEMQDEEQILGVESMVENIAKVEPFWVNRGKKNVQDEFLDEVPDKRRDPVPSDDVSDVVSNLGALTQPGETFWVARG